MSSAGEGSRDWRFYATDMIEFAEKVRFRRLGHLRCHPAQPGIDRRSSYPRPEYSSGIADPVG